MFKSPIFLLFLFLINTQTLRANSEADPLTQLNWQVLSFQTDNLEERYEISFESSGAFKIYEDKLDITADPPWSVVEKSLPQTVFATDPLTGQPTRVYEKGIFLLKLKRSESALDGPSNLRFHFVACTASICSRPVWLTIRGESAFMELAPPGTSFLAGGDKSEAPVSSVPTNSSPTTEDQPWTLAFLAMIFLAGLATNLTPCVYPMIPITLRIMSIPGTSPVISAILYSAGIVVSYTLLGFVAASSGTLFGSIMASPIVSLGFAAMMFVFGFTMLGFGDLSFLQTLGSRIGAGKPSLANTFAMGAGAGLVAAPCTGPILASLIALIAKNGQAQQGSVLLFIYSCGFALPYVFLGGLARSLTKIKLPGSVQVFTKYIFAAVMFALAAYYARIPFYKTLALLEDHLNVVIGGCALVVVATVIWAFFIESPLLRKSLHAIASVGAGLALFFAWQKSFAVKAEINWIKEERLALEVALKSNKYLFVDGWAEWCEACKKMDVSTFLDPEIIAEFKKNWVGLKFDLTENSEENELIYQKYGIQSLPSYLLIDASMQKQLLEGKTLDPEKVVLINGFKEPKELIEIIEAFKKQHPK